MHRLKQTLEATRHLCVVLRAGRTYAARIIVRKCVAPLSTWSISPIATDPARGRGDGWWLDERIVFQSNEKSMLQPRDPNHRRCHNFTNTGKLFLSADF